MKTFTFGEMSREEKKSDSLRNGATSMTVIVDAESGILHH